MELVKNVVKNPVNLLIEGETGVGKTSIIMEAARQFGAAIIRCNLSSTTSIMTLFGSSFPQNNNKKIEVHFQEGPFTKAFRLGAWLLLDEFNLAPDNVLSAIENALDTSKLMLPTESVESVDSVNEKKYIEIEKHENFRLFCTQNPNTGLFRGKREEHSSSMLSRFSPVIIEGPTDDEIKTIILHHLKNSGLEFQYCNSYAQKLSMLHKEMKAIMMNDSFPESRFAYAELTIRDVIRLADRISLIICHNREGIKSKCFYAAWSVYGSRFRDKKSRIKFEEAIRKYFKEEMPNSHEIIVFDEIGFPKVNGYLGCLHTEPNFIDHSDKTVCNNRLLCNKMYRFCLLYTSPSPRDS